MKIIKTITMKYIKGSIKQICFILQWSTKTIYYFQNELLILCVINTKITQSFYIIFWQYFRIILPFSFSFKRESILKKFKGMKKIVHGAFFTMFENAIPGKIFDRWEKLWMSVLPNIFIKYLLGLWNGWRKRIGLNEKIL